MTFLIIYCELVNIIQYGSYECDDEEVETSVIETQRHLKIFLHPYREALQVINDVEKLSKKKETVFAAHIRAGLVTQ